MSSPATTLSTYPSQWDNQYPCPRGRGDSAKDNPGTFPNIGGQAARPLPHRAMSAAPGVTGVHAGHIGALESEVPMTTWLRVDFPCAGRFGAEMSQASADPAASISQEPGLLWKMWTENATDQTAGGILLFTDEGLPTSPCTPGAWRASASSPVTVL